MQQGKERVVSFPFILLWRHFYEALHIGCDHRDADGDGEYDRCLWSELKRKTEYYYQYDSSRQLTKCTRIGENTGTVIYEYHYDADGNRTRYEKTIGGKLTESYVYAYDESNRLVRRSNRLLWTDSVTEYTYDGDGNRLFTMDYMGLCTKPEEREDCGRSDCPFHAGDFREECFGDVSLWLPDMGTEVECETARQAMEKLASLVSSVAGSHYTITEYVNDITRENEEVLAEIDLQGQTKAAYVYGTERIQKEKGTQEKTDTVYYLYDGKGSVTGTASEWGRVHGTYAYDPYGNRIRGTADSVNYYGYNGESTNVLTGLQYLRARYYDPEKGSFLTEDTLEGNLTEPLTRNRYIYTSNNPVNRSDPSGHSWISRMASAVTERVKKAAAVVTETVKKSVFRIKTVSEYAKETVETVKNTPVQSAQAVQSPSKAYRAAAATAATLKEKVTAKAAGAQSVIARTVELRKEVQSKVEKKAAKLMTEAKKQVCSTAERIQEGLGKVDWESVGKVAAGAAIIAGLGVATVCTGGIAGAVAAGALTGAAIGGGSGAVIGGICSVSSGGTFAEGAVDGFLSGTIAGAVAGGITGGAGYAISNAGDLVQGRKVTAESLAVDFAVNMVANGTAASKADDVLGVGGKSGSKADFYVTPSGEAIPSTGYRYISENAPYLDDMANSMSIPANADGTYFSFNNYNVANPGALQVPHDASIKVSFNTLQIIDDISVPYGNWGKASYFEPITTDFPQFGPGGATQVITHSPINIDNITRLPK